MNNDYITPCRRVKNIIHCEDEITLILLQRSCVVEDLNKYITINVEQRNTSSRFSNNSEPDTSKLYQKDYHKDHVSFSIH